jgi:hypothetical protein
MSEAGTEIKRNRCKSQRASLRDGPRRHIAPATEIDGKRVIERKRRTNPAFRISLTRANVCPLTGKLRSTNDEGYGSFWS